MSPLYKDRLEHQLATQQRQLVTTLMEHWAPMAAKAVAQATHMPVTQVNAQLSRLEARDPAAIPDHGGPHTGLGAAAKSNPQLWTPEELRAIFVARQGELAELVQRIQSAPPATPPQHVLITGHRGMGKSTLLHRLALAIEDDSALQGRWAPLLFREEQYTALSLDKFWRNALDALIETLERRAATQTEWLADIHALDALSARLEAVDSSTEREAQALAALHEWAERHQSRLLLLVDSTEQLFEGLSHSKAQGQQALWRLRERLSQDPVFFWVSCAYTALEAHQAYDHPFHEFFAQLPLRALTIDGMRQVFLALARTFGAGRGLPPEQAQDHVQALLTQQPERLEILLRLAGGIPRTTVVLYQLLSAGGFDSVHTDLRRLLDDMSPLYKDRLEHQLATQQRQLVATLMEHWAPMAAKVVAQVTHMPVTQVNAQLSRLEASGWVEKVRLPGTKRFGYQVAERLFNVWYLMRLAPRRLHMDLTWLVEFMRAWLSRDELFTLARDRTHGHLQQRWHDERQLEFSRALSLSLEANAPERHQLELTLFTQTQRGRIGDIVLFDVDGEDSVFETHEAYVKRFEQLRPKLEKLPFGEAEGFDKAGLIQGVLQSLNISLAEKEMIAEAVLNLSRFQCDELLKVFLDEVAELQKDYLEKECLEHLLSQVAQGRINRDCTDPQLLIKQCQAWLSEYPAAALMMLTIAMVKHPEPLPALAMHIATLPPAQCIGAKKELLLVTFGLLRRAEQYPAAASYLLQELTIDPEYADGWIMLGNLLLEKLQQPKEAEQCYREAIRLEPQSAWAFYCLGNLLQDHLKRYDEAEAAYRQAIAIDPEHAYPWNGLGNLLQDHLSRFDEAEAAYRQGMALADPDYLGPKANLARLLTERGSDEGLGLYRELLETCPSLPQPLQDEHAVVWMQAALLTGDTGEALRWLHVLQKALTTRPDDAATHQALRVQAHEIHVLKHGLALADLLAQSHHAALMKPLVLGLRAANGQTDCLLAVPQEVQDMAKEVAASLERWAQRRANARPAEPAR